MPIRRVDRPLVGQPRRIRLEVVILSLCSLLVAVTRTGTNIWDQPFTNTLAWEGAATTIGGATTTVPPSIASPATCTAQQLDTIGYQLPSDDCVQHQSTPWKQKCSFTYATKCPETPWLDHFYQNTHPASFLSLFVGCNKGMDAVNALRMGSGNRVFDKEQWKRTMFGKDDATTINNEDSDDDDDASVTGVCGQSETDQFPLNGRVAIKDAQVHCFEPVPSTARELARSAQELGWDQLGFHVVHAAVAAEDGSVEFPTNVNVGRENVGLDQTIKLDSGEKDFEEVAVYRLDTFLDKTPTTPGKTIHYLSIDVEGYDYDVIRGAGVDTLSRVQYLEFEYNWMGPWKTQRLSEVISFMDEAGFTCYWPGGSDGNIWRITNCWLDHYDLHFWSNVACVNRRLPEIQPVAEHMEGLFHQTLAKGKSLQMTATS